MILTNLTDQQHRDRRQISMDLVWEDRTALTQTLYFEAEGETAELLRPTADSFAIACLPLAAGLREKRLQVEAKLCTRLRSGLKLLNQLFQTWYPDCTMLELDAAEGFQPTYPPAQRRVTALLSGGVDGLTTVRQNRLDYPLEHPESIRACITLFGINTV